MKQQNPIKQRLMSIPEAAIYLGTTESRIRTAVSRQELPAIRIGKFIRLDVQQLERWIEEHSTPERDQSSAGEQ